MTQTFSMKLVERCAKREVLVEEEFTGNRDKADSRLSDFWNRNTPCDGSRFRATLHLKGKRAILSTISG